MWLYLKCVYWNKVTLFAYLFLALSISGIVVTFFTNVPVETKLLVFTSALSLGAFGLTLGCATDFGRETRDAYLRTKRILLAGKIVTVDDEKSDYCDLAGIRAAMRMHQDLQKD